MTVNQELKSSWNWASNPRVGKQLLGGVIKGTMYWGFLESKESSLKMVTRCKEYTYSTTRPSQWPRVWRKQWLFLKQCPQGKPDFIRTRRKVHIQGRLQDLEKDGKRTKQGMLSSMWGLECGNEGWPRSLALFISDKQIKVIVQLPWRATDRLWWQDT